MPSIYSRLLGRVDLQHGCMVKAVVIGVIIADDNALLRQALRVIVEGYPARIIAEVGDGFEACRAAEHEKPDLVILDISMPVMNGLTAAQHIRALYRDVHHHSHHAYREQLCPRGLSLW